MTNAELIKALRTCADHNAVGDKCYGECPYNGDYNECVDQMILDAADALEEKSAECISKEVIKERLLYLGKNRVLGPCGPFIWNVILNGLPHEWPNKFGGNDECSEND